MKYSGNLRWFLNVWWEEQERFVDCIVDVTKVEGDFGCFVVELSGSLKIQKAAEVQILPCSHIIIGKAVSFDCDLS